MAGSEGPLWGGGQAGRQVSRGADRQAGEQGSRQAGMSEGLGSVLGRLDGMRYEPNSSVQGSQPHELYADRT